MKAEREIRLGRKIYLAFPGPDPGPVGEPVRLRQASLPVGSPWASPGGGSYPHSDQ